MHAGMSAEGLGVALRARCAFSAAFVFRDDGGDAFVLDFGGAQGPSLEYIPRTSLPPKGTSLPVAEARLADLVLRLHSHRAWSGVLAMGGEAKRRAWTKSLELGIFSVARLDAPAPWPAQQRDFPQSNFEDALSLRERDSERLVLTL